MKKKFIIGSMAGAVVLGGAFGVNAMAGSGDDWRNGKKAELSFNEAENAAKEKVQGLTVDQVEKDEDDGRLIYEVDGTAADGRDTDLDINANSGEVIRTEHDDDDNDAEENENNGNVKVSKEEAVETAKTKGAGEVTKVELDDGHYEIELEDGKTEYEMKVNGQTGGVMESEQEQDDD